MNEDLNLLEILKDAPKGTKLYSTIWGEMELLFMGEEFLRLKTKNGGCWSFLKDGRLFVNGTEDGECVLFPSKEQRDWSKFKIDLPIDTPVMVSDTGERWCLRFYAGGDETFLDGFKERYSEGVGRWNYIVPAKDFDFENLESNKERSIC